MVDDGGLSTSQAWDDLRNELFARDKRKMSSEEGICWKEQYSELLKRGKWPEEAEAGWYDKDMLQIIDHLHPVLRKNDLLELVQDYTLTSRGTYLRYRKQNLDEINARIRATKADSADPTDPGKKREERAWLEAQKKTSQLMYQKANAQWLSVQKSKDFRKSKQHFELEDDEGEEGERPLIDGAGRVSREEKDACLPPVGEGGPKNFMSADSEGEIERMVMPDEAGNGAGDTNHDGGDSDVSSSEEDNWDEEEQRGVPEKWRDEGARDGKPTSTVAQDSNLRGPGKREPAGRKVRGAALPHKPRKMATSQVSVKEALTGKGVVTRSKMRASQRQDMPFVHLEEKCEGCIQDGVECARKPSELICKRCVTRKDSCVWGRMNAAGWIKIGQQSVARFSGKGFSYKPYLDDDNRYLTEGLIMVTLPRLNNATVDPERLKDALKGLVPEQPSGTHFRYPAEDTKAYAIKWLEELRKKKSGATRPSRRRKKDDGDAVSDGAAVTDVGTANIGDPHEDGDLNGEAAPDNAKAANDEEAVGESDATRQSGAVNDHAKHRAEGQPDMSTSSSATRSHKRGRGGHNQFNELTGTSAGREENADTPTDRWPVKKKRKTRHSSTSPTPDDRQASSSRDGGWTDGAVEVNGVSQSACNQRTVHAQEIVASSTGDTVVPITESANGSSSRVTTLTGPSSMVSHTGGVNGVVAQTETAAAATTPVANSVLPTKAMAPISHFVLADSNANSGKPSTARGVFRVPNVDFNSYTPRATCDDKTALGTFGTAEPTATWGSSSIWPTNVRRETGAGLNDLTGTSTPSILSTSAWLMSSKGSLPPSTGDAPKASATPPNGNANTTGERTAVPTTHRSHNGDDSDSRAAMHQAVQHHRTLIAHYLARYGDLQAELTDLEATMERLQMEARDQICSVVDCMRMEERATKQPYGQYRSSDLPDPVIVHPRIIDTIRTEQAQVFNSQLERMCNGVEVELRRERYASTVKGKERSVD